MKLALLSSFLGIVPVYLVYAAPQSVTLWQFDDYPSATPTTEGTEFLVPIGTSSAEAGAETTYIYNVVGTQTLSQASAVQTTFGTFAETIVASASGWRASELYFKDLGATVGVDCHLTASAAGECLLAVHVPVASATSTVAAIITGAAIPFAVPVSVAGSGGNGTATAPGSQPTQSNRALRMGGQSGIVGWMTAVVLLGEVFSAL